MLNGVDPSDTKKAQKAEGTIETETFEIIAREWHTRFSSSRAASHGNKIIRRFELNVFPWLGNRPIKSITAPDLRMAIGRIEAKGTLETAHRNRRNTARIDDMDMLIIIAVYVVPKQTDAIHLENFENFQERSLDNRIDPIRSYIDEPGRKIRNQVFKPNPIRKFFLKVVALQVIFRHDLGLSIPHCAIC